VVAEVLPAPPFLAPPFLPVDCLLPDFFAADLDPPELAEDFLLAFFVGILFSLKVTASGRF
ncbi:MAG TPA: hypothetical protein VJQ56_05070, partial [Blastocatellia bacterium]|nr:hypothetical protein [Blastocatellia bacterium]